MPRESRPVQAFLKKEYGGKITENGGGGRVEDGVSRREVEDRRETTRRLAEIEQKRRGLEEGGRVGEIGVWRPPVEEKDEKK